jgi:glycosyltransferase involved in cell wall biosynthesis
MRVSISTTRPFHAAMLANALLRHRAEVTLWTSAPRRFFRGLDPAARLRLVPSALQTAMHLARFDPPPNLLHADSWLYDHTVATVLSPGDLFIGWASAALASGNAARRRGARFVLDRACPHVDAQQAIVAAEATKLGVSYTPQPAWFRERQLAEYEAAHRILAPSDYTRRSFPQHLRARIIPAPLFGRCAFPAEVRLDRNSVFTVGVVGGDPLRKGYLYLLQAWKSLNLPHARLLLRTDADLQAYPALAHLLAGLSNVEILSYVPDISAFYRQCDAFVLPSVDDGFGMALFEAMAHALPSIATTHCGASELVHAGHEGLVVPPFDSPSLAAALESLYRDEERRRSIALAGRARVQALGAAAGHSPLYDSAISNMLTQLL